jgi:hypothetical protein
MWSEEAKGQAMIFSNVLFLAAMDPNPAFRHEATA